MKTELLIVCSEAPPQVGGIASLLGVVCGELARRDEVRVHLLCRRGADASLAAAVHADLSWPSHGALNLPYQLKNAITYRRLVAQHGIQRVIFFDAAARLYGIGVSPNIPSTMVVYGTELLAPSAKSERISRRLWLQQRAMRRCDRIIAISRAVASLATALVPEVEPDVVYPCYDPERIYDPARHIESPYTSKRGTFILLTVSRIAERKGHEDVLRLLARVRSRLPMFHYYVVGDGPHRGHLESVVEELGLQANVTFVGGVPTAKLGAYYHFADLFVMLSRASREGVEGFGLTFVEAALSGTPSFASRHGGAAEAVQHDVTGWTADANEPGMDEEFVRLVEDESRRRRYAEAGKAWAERTLSPASFTEALLR